MGIIEKLRSLSSNTERPPHECGYGKTPGAVDNCELVLAPDRGVMYNLTVYCTEEHAALAQAESLL